MNLAPYLEDLESRIDPAVEDELLAEWEQFASGNFRGAIFSPRRQVAAPSSLIWPHVLVNDALADPGLMLLQQLEPCSAALADGSGALLTVRANYGTCIVPSLFGAEIFFMDREIDTLPTSKPLPGGAAAMPALLERGTPEPTSGLGAQVFATTDYFQDALRPYPKLSQYIQRYHPDMQGPMDIVELLWGSRIFLDALDQPELVHAVLNLVTQTYLHFIQTWFTQLNSTEHAPRYTFHWAMLHRGTIMLRDDSAMNFSPRMFEQFIEPYDQRLLDELGGGAMHACGKIDHYIHRVGQMRGIFAFNLSQPEYNDMEKVYQHTIDRGIPLIGLQRAAAETALTSGRDLRGLVHCW